MATLKLDGKSYVVDHAVKGDDYIHGYAADGSIIINIEGISDFSGITYDGTYLSPTECLTELCNDVKYCGGAIKTADGRNVPVAPSGFGFGEPMEEVTASSTETYNEYCAKIDAILTEMPDNTTKLIKIKPPYNEAPGFGFSVALLYKSATYYASVTALGGNGIASYRWQLMKRNGIWFPFEWIEPPMISGVEYRTTERINENSVFKKWDSASGTIQYRLDGEDTWNNYCMLMGAAPAGFGYGDKMTYIDMNSATYSGMTFEEALETVLASMDGYSCAQIQFYDTSFYANKFVGRLWKYTANYVTLEAITYSGYKVILRKQASTWQPWEWENPPMAVGTEYRTTERCEGEVVYRKRIKYTNADKVGKLDDTTFFNVSHGISNFKKLVRCVGTIDAYMLPYISTDGGITAVCHVTSAAITLRTINTEWSSREWTFDIAYTKTT